MVLITCFILWQILQSHCWGSICSVEKANILSCSVPTPQQDGENTILSCPHCSGAKSRKGNIPALLLEVILIFVAFDFMGYYGLVLLLTFLPLLSHSEPGSVCPSLLPAFLSSFLPCCLPPSLPSILSSFRPSGMWLGWAPPT